MVHPEALYDSWQAFEPEFDVSRALARGCEIALKLSKLHEKGTLLLSLTCTKPWFKRDLMIRKKREGRKPVLKDGSRLPKVP